MREKLMKNALNKGLIPSEDEIKKIVAQMMQISPTQIPVLLLQIEVARLLLKVIDRFRGELNESIKHLEDKIDRQ